MLDERLSLAAALYQPCDWGADIGTDHAYLPCHLLRAGICQHMIAADVSEKALADCVRTILAEHQASNVSSEDDLRALQNKLKERKGLGV